MLYRMRIMNHSNSLFKLAEEADREERILIKKEKEKQLINDALLDKEPYHFHTFTINGALSSDELIGDTHAKD